MKGVYFRVHNPLDRLYSDALVSCNPISFRRGVFTDLSSIRGVEPNHESYALKISLFKNIENHNKQSS